MNKISIGIPTYNRRESVSQLLQEIIDEKFTNDVHVLVVDDGSSDNTFDYIQRFAQNNNIRILGNTVNRGFAKTFLRLFEDCETEYLMLIADDDMVSAEGVYKLISFLDRVSPDFVSTAWQGVDGKPMRTKKREQRIEWADLRGSSNHLPGLVFRVSSVRPFIESMYMRMSQGCYATLMYPQVVLLLLQAISSSSCWWCPVMTGGYRPAGPMPSQLFDSNGESYGSVAGVWREQLAFIDLYTYIISVSNSQKSKKIFENFKTKECLNLYNRLVERMGNESEIGLFYFRLGAAFKSFRHPFRSIGQLFRYVALRVSADYVLLKK